MKKTMTAEEYSRTIRRKRENKYGNKKVFVDNHQFDSKFEAKRHGFLRILEKQGEIQNLRRQVPYKLVVDGLLICTYIADYVYEQNGKTIVEDAKGVVTREFRIKQKLMKAIHGIDILITKKQSTPKTLNKCKI